MAEPGPQIFRIDLSAFEHIPQSLNIRVSLLQFSFRQAESIFSPQLREFEKPQEPELDSIGITFRKLRFGSGPQAGKLQSIRLFHN